MPSKNRDVASLADMVQAIGYIQTFTANLAADDYFNDMRTISAVERQFTILGEASGRISDAFRQAHPTLDWRRIIGLRNIVTHRYDDVDQDILWNIIQAELPALLAQIEAVLPGDGASR
jgi:uncharacterized protein with HEPN domain